MIIEILKSPVIRIFIVLFLTICCSKSDNDDGVMEWVAETPADFRFTDRYVGVDVPVEGCTFAFRCTNYPTVRFASASPAYDLSTDDAVKHDGFYFGKIESGLFTVEFAPNESGFDTRTAKITLAVGDVTYDFYFVQTGSVTE